MRRGARAPLFVFYILQKKFLGFSLGSIQLQQHNNNKPIV
jgi:hypothetical protein